MSGILSSRTLNPICKHTTCAFSFFAKGSTKVDIPSIPGIRNTFLGPEQDKLGNI